MSRQVAVLIDFEDLLAGAEDSLPGNTEPVTYAAVELVCRSYGNAVVRRAYGDWTRERFSRHQDHLALNGVDLIHIGRGIHSRNVADIRLAIDAMELTFTRPDVGVVVLVAGDADYSPLVQRLREFGKRVVGIGTEAFANRRLVSLCTEYRYWPTMVAQVDSKARVAVAAEFDIDDAEWLLIDAIRRSNQPVLAAVLRSLMLALDPSFDERNYGCGSFREFLGLMSHVVVVEEKAYDLVVALPITGRNQAAHASVQATVAQEHVEPAAPVLLTELRALGADLPLRPEVRDAILARVHQAWCEGRLDTVSDIGDVLLDQRAGHLPNKNTRLHLRRALVTGNAPMIPLVEQPVTDLRPLRRCSLAAYDGTPPADWVQLAHVAWLAWIMRRLRHHRDLDERIVEAFFAGSTSDGVAMVARARELLERWAA